MCFFEDFLEGAAAGGAVTGGSIVFEDFGGDVAAAEGGAGVFAGEGEADEFLDQGFALAVGLGFGVVGGGGGDGGCGGRCRRY